MFSYILIAIDRSELAQKIEPAGLALAKPLKAEATAVTVTEPWDELSIAGPGRSWCTEPVANYDEAVTAPREPDSMGRNRHRTECGRGLHHRAL